MTSPPADAKSEYGSDIDVDIENDTLIATSEYGSEFDAEEENLIGDLLSRIASTAPKEKTVVFDAEGSYESGRGNGNGNGNGDGSESGPRVLLHSSPPSAVVRLQRGAAVELESRAEGNGVGLERSVSVEAVEFDGVARNLPKDIATDERNNEQSTWPISLQNPEAASETTESPSEDTRSPLLRFRTSPKKPLSVTDLVSPAWCELQYWYVLTKFGRKPRTAAMKQGSKVHKTLEEQVHVFVPIQTASKEDRFGLKIWNTIQGLRRLRATGLTRELEVWGVLEGQLVNGVIDELSFTRPDADLEKSLEKSKKTKEKNGAAVPPGQLSITDSFSQTGSNANPGTSSQGDEASRTVYIADVKTRGYKSVPAAASLRPTWMQLMLYRKLLESLAKNTVDADIVFSRYNLRPLESFTETFMTDISTLNGDTMDVDPGSSAPDPGPAIFSEIHAHNNLSALWSLMMSEFSQTFSSASPILRAEFRYSKTGELIGSEIFTHDDKAIEKYVTSEMSWWKGEREPVGVEVEEAFKCRMCDFAEECQWRKDKVEEATEKHRRRLQGNKGENG